MSISFSPADLERTIARTKSYVGAAIAVFLLYNLFWLPGFITNIAYLAEARRMGRTAGQPASGVGCLWALFFYGLLLPIIGIIVTVIVAVTMNRLRTASPIPVAP